MDPASQALVQNLPSNVRRTYAALAERCDVRVSVTSESVDAWPTVGWKPKNISILISNPLPLNIHR